jgi:chromosome segregation ATPase
MDRQVIQNAIDSEMKCVKSTERIEVLTQKRTALNTSRSKLEVIIEETMQKKQAALDGVVNADSSPERVKEAKDELSEAERGLEDIDDLLVAVDHEIQLEKGRLDALEGEMANNAGNVWNTIYSRMAQDLLKRMSHEIVFLYAANRRQRRPLNYSYFLESLFPEPNRHIINAVGPDLDTLFKEVVLGEAKKSKKG